MNETKAIIDAYRLAQTQNVRAALATLVSVEGSAYRRPGARMLITEDGQTTGVLSGGCLEGDVCERAARVIESGEPTVVRYDTTSDQDIVWGLGVGCKGIVRVLIEPATVERLDGVLQLLTESSVFQRRAAIATVVHVQGDADVGVGSRALLYPNGAMKFCSDGLIIGSDVTADLRQAVHSGTASLKRYRRGTVSIEVSIEVVEPRAPLVIFGAGDDVAPLVSLAHGLGWHTTVVDTRARVSSHARFNGADDVVLCRPEDVGSEVVLTPRSVIVVMTHNYLHDLELLKTILTTKLAYIGLLGPKRRAERLLLDLTDGDELATASLLHRIHAPAGLDIGAETPSEIALSVVAEIKAILTKREGGLLRRRKGSIHSACDVTWEASRSPVVQQVAVG